MRRALGIDEGAYGPEHPEVARDLNNLALLFLATERASEAGPPMARALAILLRFTADTGHRHPELDRCSSNYADVLRATGLDASGISARLAALAVESGLAAETLAPAPRPPGVLHRLLARLRLGRAV